MLRFCLAGLPPDRVYTSQQHWLYLEGFLLHYRAIVEFLSGSKPKYPNKLTTARPLVWAGRPLSPQECAAFVDPARTLLATHWGSISNYLQHCTLERYERAHAWDVPSINAEIAPILAAFEASFPRK